MRIAAPRTAPRSEPIPPSTSEHTAMIDRSILNVSGVTTVSFLIVNSPPATPPTKPLTANASILARFTSIPDARAAVSSALIAAHERPRRESCSRRTAITARTSTTTTRK
jgi:hypothetical protein